MSKRKKIYLVLIIILALVWIGIYRSSAIVKNGLKTAGLESKTTSKVKVQTIKTQDEISVPIFLSGEVKPKKYTIVKSLVNGFLQEAALVGEEIRVGEELFRVSDDGIETNYYNALSGLVMAEENLRQVEAGLEENLKQAELAQKSAEAGLDLAKSNAENTKISSDAALNQAKNGLSTAQKNAEQGLAAALDAGQAADSSAYNSVDQMIRYLGNGDIKEYAFNGLLSYNSQARVDVLNQFEMAKSLYNTNYANDDANYANMQIDDVENELQEMEALVTETKKLADLAYIDLNYCVPTMNVPATAIDGYKAQLIYLETSLNMANSAIKGAKNGVKSAKINGEAAVEAAQEGLRMAQAQHDVAVKAADTQVTQAQNQFDNAQASLKLTKNGLDLKKLGAKAQLNAAQTQFDLVKNQYDNLMMPAKFSGVVISNLVEIGQQVNIGTPILEIGDVYLAEIVLEIGTDEVKQLRLGQEVKILTNGTNKTNLTNMSSTAFVGQLTEIEPAGMGASGKVKIKIEADNSDYRFVPGEIARVEIDLTIEKPGVILVPLKAVVIGQNEKYVFIVETSNQKLVTRDDDFSDELPVTSYEVNKRVVEIGETYGEMVEIASGLNEGDVVVTENGGFLADGESVEISN